MRICTLMMVVFLSVHAAIAQEPATTQPVRRMPQVVSKRVVASDSLRKTAVYRIKYAAAPEVAKAVNRELTKILNQKPKHDGFIVDSPVVIIPEAISNSLLVSAKPSYMDKISDMILKLDKAPTQIMIQVIITDIEDGKETVLSRPQVMTLDGSEAFIEVGSDKKLLRIQLKPTVIRQADEETTAPQN